METSVIAVTPPAVEGAERTAFWDKQQLAEQAKSGMSLRQFGQVHGLSYNQLKRWRQRLQPKPVPLIPVQLAPGVPGAGGACLELHYRQCYRLVIPAGVEAERLRQVVTVLEQCHADATGRA